MIWITSLHFNQEVFVTFDRCRRGKLVPQSAVGVPQTRYTTTNTTYHLLPEAEENVIMTKAHMLLPVIAE